MRALLNIEPTGRILALTAGEEHEKGVRAAPPTH